MNVDIAVIHKGDVITVSQISGELADRIRERSGLSGDVLMFEAKSEFAWSDVTFDTNYDFILTVGGVFIDFNWGYWGESTAINALSKWLEGDQGQ